ncbi:MAG TPA: phosphopyruvate hydratase [Patescibacteria group bacterium]|nr:phosphopyruvate hydratase [bacterium]HRY56793.1 phosphopyruvate hydratase [Patescibacteria group bacterium]
MRKIENIRSQKILDSRGNWTLETKVTLDDGSVGVQPVPSGASVGENEAVYIDVEKAADFVSTTINDVLVGKDPSNQKSIDENLIKMDGTSNKSRLGANSILSVSLACAKSAAVSAGLELYQYLSLMYSGKQKLNGDLKFPTPIFNIINGGEHAKNKLSFQEFMVIPALNTPYNKALQMGASIYKDLKKILLKDDFETGVGDEGGFEPRGLSARTALDFLEQAASVQFDPGNDVFFGLDIAAGSFYENGKYCIDEENLELSSDEVIKYYQDLFMHYKIIYLEDPMFERDEFGWTKFYKQNAGKYLVVADDLVVTNPKILERVAKEKMANAVIVKPNQIGTLTETLDFIKLARKSKMDIVISHRSGDNVDSFISDLAVAVDADFMKSGAPARGERVAKYNRLLEIFYEF